MKYLIIISVFAVVISIILAYVLYIEKNNNKNLDKNEDLLIKKYYELLENNGSLKSTIESLSSTLESYKIKNKDYQELINNFNDRYEGAVSVAKEFEDKYYDLKAKYDIVSKEFNKSKEDLEFAEMLLSCDNDNWN